MSDLIRIKGGSGAVPELQSRELGYKQDEKALYIGTESGNAKLCAVGDADKINGNTAKITALENALKTLTEQTIPLLATTDHINGLVAEINARLDALTKTDE